MAAPRWGAPAAFPWWQEVTPLLAAEERDIAGGGGVGGVPGRGGALFTPYESEGNYV